ncbi:MAG: sigma 54 modulation/S30EA ribosomal C-terminal domain-containing protein [Mycobacterium sp.]|nr:sigma 54 modulation/S30EA ribosomal C-terminal domain-containing protein [Mycobacterium sp.]
MRDDTELLREPDINITTHGDFPGAAEYARDKIGELARQAHRPVLRAHIKFVKHHDPAVEQPVVAQANLDVDGQLVRAQVRAATAREAVDRLQARLRRRLEHVEKQYDKRIHTAPDARGWRHDYEPTPRPTYFPRPAAERQVLRRQTFAVAPCSIDEAVEELDFLDYDFHMFTEKSTRTAAVVYRDGSAGYRVALVDPGLRAELAPFEAPVTISPHTVACMTVEQATERLTLTGLPFLFFIDADQGRASVLYHRYDGHYGLITPAG